MRATSHYHLTIMTMKTAFYEEIMIGRTRRQKRNIRLITLGLVIAVITMVVLAISIYSGLTQLN